MAERIFLIDGHSHLYRAFYAVKGLTSPEGRPVNAVYGFTAILRKLIRDQKPDYLAVAFDLPAPTFRHRLSPEYKATREKPPDDFIAQIPMVHEVIEALRIPIFSLAGYEADDLLATLAVQAAARGIEVFLVTGDKDAEQLLAPNIHIFDAGKDEILTVETLRERDGIAPEQVIEVMGLCGDTSDNVKGIPKVGPKTAIDLIHQFGTLDNVLAHAAEISKPKLRENLLQYGDQARLSRRLVTLDRQVPIQVSLEDCRVKPIEPDRVIPLFQRFGFHQFLADLVLPPTQEAKQYHLVDTKEKFQEFLEQFRKQKRFAIDLETTSTSPTVARICGLSFAWKPKEAWYLATLGPIADRRLETKEVLAALRPVLVDPAVEKIGQNIKYDMIVLRHYGIELQGVAFDTMVAAYVLNAERRRYGLDSLALDFLNYRMIPITDLLGKGKKQVTMDCVPTQQVCDYSCADADITLRLADLLQEELARQDTLDLFRQIEMPLIEVLTEMENEGIGLDVAELKEMSGWLEGQMAAMEKEIHREAGEAFNIGSPKQLSTILFEKLQLPKGRRTKTGVSTDSDALEELADTHRLPKLILEYRQLAKLKSTYVDALPQMVNPKTGRVHTSFNMTTTATGRLSSSDPNLQNIPIRTELGERIRKAFIPSTPAHRLLSADYSQIELRILAHISGDASLRQAFAQDEDIHRFVAAQINGIAPEAVTSAMRTMAKRVNFGILYGLSAYGLSRDLHITPEEAARFIEAYFAKYPGVREFIDRTVREARKIGYVTTLLKRRRPLPGLNDPDRATRAFAERAAVNTVIQGTAADMIKIAMIRIHRRLRDEALRTRMLLQIHDELLFEFPPAEEAQATKLIVDEMVGALVLDVPIKVNVAVGQNWMEA